MTYNIYMDFVCFLDYLCQLTYLCCILDEGFIVYVFIIIFLKHNKKYIDNCQCK